MMQIHWSKSVGTLLYKIQMLIYEIAVQNLKNKCIKYSSCSKQHKNHFKYFLIYARFNVTLGLISEMVDTAITGPNRVHIV